MKVSELISVLRTAKTIEDIEQYREEILDLIPAAKIMVGYDQQNRAHQYDLWKHSLHTVINLPKNLEDDEKRRLLYYVRYHDDRVSLRMKHLRRHLNMGASLEKIQTLMHLQLADAKVHIIIPIIQERIDVCGQWAGEYANRVYEDILNGK